MTQMLPIVADQMPQQQVVLDANLSEELRLRFPDNPRLVTVIECKMKGWSEEKIGQDAFLPKTLSQSAVSRILTHAGVRLEPSEGIPKKIHIPPSGDRDAATWQIEAESQAGTRTRRPPGVLFPGPLFESAKGSPASKILPPPDDWRAAVITAREERDKKRGEVEDAAVETVEALYRHQGYCVTTPSVETQNLGWDLEFRKNGCALLRVEVKGTSYAEWPKIQVELTRKEREKSAEHSDSYRLAIVRNALLNPKCAIYTRDGDEWKRADDFAGDDKDAPVCLVMGPSNTTVVFAPAPKSAIMPP